MNAISGILTHTCPWGMGIDEINLKIEKSVKMKQYIYF